jgi:hypothetical protein
VSIEQHEYRRQPVRGVVRDSDGQTVSASIVLTGEQAAAVEGWRVANHIDSQSEALRELVRIGLLSEIGRIYRMISGVRGPDDMGDTYDAPG